MCLSIASACGGVTHSPSSELGVIGAGASAGSGGGAAGSAGGQGSINGGRDGGSFTGPGTGGRDRLGFGGISSAGGAVSQGGVPAAGGTISGPVPKGQYQTDAGVVCTWTAPSAAVSTTPCGPWQGGSLLGVSGLDRSCPCAGSPQHLAYGNTIYDPGTTITGPQAEIYDGQIVSCSYDITWNGRGLVSTGWVSLPVFGGGFGRLEVPQSLVSAARAKCSTPSGPEVGVTTFQVTATRIAGAWVRCPSSVAPLQGSVLRFDGILLHPDGAFQALRDDGTDHFAIVDACDAAGLWGLDSGQISQLDLFMGTGEDVEVWKLYDGAPRRLTMDNNGVVTTELVSVE